MILPISSSISTQILSVSNSSALMKFCNGAVTSDDVPFSFKNDIRASENNMAVSMDSIDPDICCHY